MYRIPDLLTLPDQIESLARELEEQHASEVQAEIIEKLRAHATVIAESIEASRLLADSSLSSDCR